MTRRFGGNTGSDDVASGGGEAGGAFGACEKKGNETRFKRAHLVENRNDASERRDPTACATRFDHVYACIYYITSEYLRINYSFFYAARAF